MQPCPLSFSNWYLVWIMTKTKVKFKKCLPCWFQQLTTGFLVYIFTTGTLQFSLTQLLEMLPQWGAKLLWSRSIATSKTVFGFDNMCFFPTLEKSGLDPTWSDFIYYGKTWNGKKYPFTNVKIVCHLIWETVCPLNFIQQHSSLSFCQT